MRDVLDFRCFKLVLRPYGDLIPYYVSQMILDFICIFDGLIYHLVYDYTNVRLVVILLSYDYDV